MWNIPCSIPNLFFSRGDLIHVPWFSVIYSILYLQPTPLPWANIACKKLGSKYFMDLWPTYTSSRIYSLSCTCSQWPVVDEQAGLCAHKILFTNPGGCPMGCGLPNAALDPNIQLPSGQMLLHKFPEVTCLQASSSHSSIGSFSMKTPLSTKIDTLAPALISPPSPPPRPRSNQSQNLVNSTL